MILYVWGRAWASAFLIQHPGVTIVGGQRMREPMLSNHNPWILSPEYWLLLHNNFIATIKLVLKIRVPDILKYKS